MNIDAEVARLMAKFQALFDGSNPDEEVAPEVIGGQAWPVRQETGE
jgi:hypothetical protein